MQLTTHPDAGAFLAVAEAPLARDEARHNLMLGIAARVRDGYKYGEAPPLFLTIHERGALIAAAVRTPPHPLILYCEEVHTYAIGGLVEQLLETVPDLPGVNGEPHAAETFSNLWTPRTQTQARIDMRTTIYCLRDVDPPVGVPGAMRMAQHEDAPFLAEWMQQFHHEAVPNHPPADARKVVLRFLESGTLAVWNHERPVSMVGSSRGTLHGAAISAVYTPPENRRNGYASAVVAALSQRLLDQGNTFCVLYADQANPTSNQIYQRIGYRPIAEAVQYRFESAKPEVV